jgi:hypothetical protein
MQPKKLVLYVFMFVLGLAFNLNINGTTVKTAAEYVTSIDNDIGFTNTEEGVIFPQLDVIAVNVQLGPVTVIGKYPSKKIVSTIPISNAARIELLEMIDSPVTLFIIPDIYIPDIQEELKNC